MAGEFADTPTFTAVKDRVREMRAAYASGNVDGIRQAAIQATTSIDRYVWVHPGEPDIRLYRAALRPLVQLESVRDLKQARPLLLELETLVGVGPGLEGERYRKGAMSIGAMSSTSKKGVLGKFGLNVPGIDSTIASMLTGSPDYVAPGAQKSEAATKAGLPGVKGARRKTRKGRKGKKMTRRRR